MGGGSRVGRWISQWQIALSLLRSHQPGMKSCGCSEADRHLRPLEESEVLKPANPQVMQYAPPSLINTEGSRRCCTS